MQGQAVPDNLSGSGSATEFRNDSDFNLNGTPSPGQLPSSWPSQCNSDPARIRGSVPSQVDTEEEGRRGIGGTEMRVRAAY